MAFSFSAASGNFFNTSAISFSADDHLSLLVESHWGGAGNVAFARVLVIDRGAEDRAERGFDRLQAAVAISSAYCVV